MITHRQKQLGIIAFAVIFLLIVTYNIHQDVRIRHLPEDPLYLDYSHDALKQFAPDSTTSAASASTEFFDHVKGKLAELIQAGVLQGPPSNAAQAEEAAPKTDDSSLPAITASADNDYVLDLLNLDTESSTDSSSEASSTEASINESPTITWSQELSSTVDPPVSESSSTVSVSAR